MLQNVVYNNNNTRTLEKVLRVRVKKWAEGTLRREWLFSVMVQKSVEIIAPEGEKDLEDVKKGFR